MNFGERLSSEIISKVERIEGRIKVQSDFISNQNFEQNFEIMNNQMKKKDISDKINDEISNNENEIVIKVVENEEEIKKENEMKENVEVIEIGETVINKSTDSHSQLNDQMNKIDEENIFNEKENSISHKKNKNPILIIICLVIVVVIITFLFIK